MDLTVAKRKVRPRPFPGKRGPVIDACTDLCGRVGGIRQTSAMATWIEFVGDAPEMAAAVAGRFAAHKHHVLATIRQDGSPRVSGTEVEFLGDGTVRLGSMLNAVKARDLHRDPRFALHSNPGHHSMDGGDAKIVGTAIELVDPEALQNIFDAAPPESVPYIVFDLGIEEVVLTSLVANHMQIDLWRPETSVKTFTR